MNVNLAPITELWMVVWFEAGEKRYSDLITVEDIAFHTARALTFHHGRVAWVEKAEFKWKEVQNA